MNATVPHAPTLWRRHTPALELLAPSAAHDINNLLLVVGMSLDLVEEDPRLLTELIPAMRQALDRTATLNRQLLSCVKRAHREDPEFIDVGDALSGLASLLGLLAGHHVETTIDTSACRSAIHIGRGFFDQLVMNLVANARDARPSAIWVTARDADHVDRRGVIIEVSDDGVGMLPETRDRIFEPLFTTKGGVGTGIGLPTVLGIVDNAGGHIEFDSRPGAGTTFRIWLPAAAARAAESAA